MMLLPTLDNQVDISKIQTGLTASHFRARNIRNGKSRPREIVAHTNGSPVALVHAGNKEISERSVTFHELSSASCQQKCLKKH